MISFLRSIILQLLFIQKFQHFIWSVYSVVECFCNNCSIHSKICFQFSNYHLAVLLFSLLVLFNSLVLNISFKNLTFFQKLWFHSKMLYSFKKLVFFRKLYFYLISLSSYMQIWQPVMWSHDFREQKY